MSKKDKGIVGGPISYKSGFYGLSNTKKGVRSTFGAAMKQNLKKITRRPQGK